MARKPYIERHKSVPIWRKLFPSQDTQGPDNSCHVGIYWIAHDVCYHMRTNVPGLQSYLSVCFCIVLQWPN